MKSQIVSTIEHHLTPNTDAERAVFLRATTSHETAHLEVRAPGGGWVKEVPDLNTSFTAADLVQLRFTSPEQLRVLAYLCEQAASRMEAMQLARISMGVDYVVKTEHPDLIRRNGTTKDLPPTRG